eukprot:TRINITY_DN9402_c0_g2_i1.p1 TRINITY_DN9402_c0_g2~~TRINITY_DN9402_c0_g2_i1.p1  ORF type:complete len:738 (-),score=162.47 TRINITY_DN9402_c0_g2_i1:26-2239(-)
MATNQTVEERITQLEEKLKQRDALIYGLVKRIDALEALQKTSASRGVVPTPTAAKQPSPRPAARGISPSHAAARAPSPTPAAAKQPSPRPASRGVSPARTATAAATKQPSPRPAARGVSPTPVRPAATRVAPPPTATVASKPASPPARPKSAPAVRLQLEFVYGYSGRRKNTIAYTASGEIIYPAASVVVLFDKPSHVQRFFTKHNAEVLALAIARDGRTVASAQGGQAPYICVWDAVTLEKKHHIQVHEHDISAIAFSRDGKRLVSVGVDQDMYSLLMWELGDAEVQQLCCVPLPSLSKAHAVACSTVSDDIVVVGEGDDPVLIQTLLPSNVLQERHVGMHLDEATCVAFNAAGAMFITTVTGKIYAFDSDLHLTAQAVHGDAAVFSLAVADDCIFTGGAGGDAKKWSFDLTYVRRSNFSEETLIPTVSSLAYYAAEKALLVGTTESELIEVRGGDDGTPSFVTQGHSSTLHGLAAHPLQPMFATAAFDKSVRVWDAQRKLMLAVLDCNESALCTAFAPDGVHLAVGLTTGRFAVTNVQTLDIVVEKRLRSSAVYDIRFSPEGHLLAVASKGVVDIFSADNYERIATLEGPDSAVQHVDWSTDGKYLQGSTDSDELVTWNVATKMRVRDAALVKAISWSSFTCHVGMPVQGVNTPDGARVSAVDRASHAELLVVATGRGHMLLYRYPCDAAGSDSIIYGGHAGIVGNARFLQDERTLLSVGGDDFCIMQWRVLTHA